LRPTSRTGPARGGPGVLGSALRRRSVERDRGDEFRRAQREERDVHGAFLPVGDCGKLRGRGGRGSLPRPPGIAFLPCAYAAEFSSAAPAVCDSARSGEERKRRRCQLDYRSSQRDPLVSVQDALLPAPTCGAPPDQRCVGGPSSPKNAGDRRPNSGTGAVRARRSAAETGEHPGVWLDGSGPRPASLRGPARRGPPRNRGRGRAARNAAGCSTGVPAGRTA